MKRRIVCFLLGLSLLISTVSLVLWPLSYFWSATVAHIGRSTTNHCWFACGQLVWMRQSGAGLQDVFADAQIRPGAWHLMSGRYRARHYDSVDRWNSFRQSLRFHTSSTSVTFKSGRAVAQRFTVIPFWPIAWLFAMPPAIALQRYRKRRRRIREGLCVHCGYDLRGSGERCPECGAPRNAGDA